MVNVIREAVSESVRLKQLILAGGEIPEQVAGAAARITEALRAGHRILFGGNGGSAADAQHLAAELSGRFYLERKALCAEAISVNIPFLTAVSNDYTFEYSYERYLEGAAKPGDIVVLLSTSGNSVNILRAARYAKDNRIFVIALTGSTGGKLAGMADLAIRVPSDDTPRIQEVHMLLGHCICQIVEHALYGD